MQRINGDVSIKSRRMCSVPECRTYCSGKISIHRFPLEKEKADKWRQALNIEKPVSKYMQVCSKHFNHDDYFFAHSRTQRKRLKNGAVPSRNLPMTYDLKKSLRMNRNESNRRYQNPIVYHVPIQEDPLMDPLALGTEYSETQTIPELRDHDYTRKTAPSIEMNHPALDLGEHIYNICQKEFKKTENISSNALEPLNPIYIKCKSEEEKDKIENVDSHSLSSSSETVVDVDELMKNNETIIAELTRENETLLKENTLLRKLISEMDNKNNLLTFKISRLEKERDESVNEVKPLSNGKNLRKKNCKQNNTIPVVSDKITGKPLRTSKRILFLNKRKMNYSDKKEIPTKINNNKLNKTNSKVTEKNCNNKKTLTKNCVTKRKVSRK